jgi:uncharacterized protein (TIGR00297 family)
MTIQFLVGLFLGIAIAFLAWKARSLSLSGALAAALTGGLIFGLGGLPWAVLLLTFFISSSALSRLFENRKRMVSEKFSKGNQRDWGQVLANGGLGTLLVILSVLRIDSSWSWLAYVGAMAAVNADTWATELGVFSPQAPRLITNGAQVERGTSGAISLWGSLASLAGAVLIGIVAMLVRPNSGWTIIAAAAAGGMAGSFFDSYLGATVQAIYFCPVCQKETERHPQHTCGNKTTLVRGWVWLNNDLVNLACSLIGASIAGLFWLVMV